jgi:hypothetical protein
LLRCAKVRRLRLGCWPGAKRAAADFDARERTGAEARFHRAQRAHKNADRNDRPARRRMGRAAPQTSSGWCRRLGLAVSAVARVRNGPGVAEGEARVDEYVYADLARRSFPADCRSGASFGASVHGDESSLGRRHGSATIVAVAPSSRASHRYHSESRRPPLDCDVSKAAGPPESATAQRHQALSCLRT